MRERPAWKALEKHHRSIERESLRDLFAADPDRGTRLVLEAEGIYFDYSKNRVTDTTVELLLELAEECGLRERIDAMFAGEHINVTEDRAVLHVAASGSPSKPKASTWTTRRTASPRRRSNC